MVRARIPGGRLTADQYLALDAIADSYANGSLRITTREGIQFHGVVKAGLKSAIGEINGALLTTLAACGDVVRNVTTVPAPIRDAVHRRLEADARGLSTYLLPRTGAYHEIWVDGAPWQEAEGAAQEPDPLYGERYLPRKFKIGPRDPRRQHDRRLDQRSRDRGAVRGRAPRRVQFPARRRPRDDPQPTRRPTRGSPPRSPSSSRGICSNRRALWCGCTAITATAATVVTPGSNTSSPRTAKTGARERLSEYLGKDLEPCREMPPFAVPDHLGWHEQGDGRLYLGIPVSSGRIVDNGQSRIRTALREIVERFRSNPILMPSQDII